MTKRTFREIIISSGPKMKMIVKHTIVKGRKNRKGEPFIISETKHVKGRATDYKYESNTIAT